MGKATLALAVAAFGIAVSAQAEITYVPDDKVQELQKQFKEAKAPDAVRLDFEKNHRWTCKLYGVRSQMQVEKASDFITLMWKPIHSRRRQKWLSIVVRKSCNAMKPYRKVSSLKKAR